MWSVLCTWKPKVQLEKHVRSPRSPDCRTVWVSWMSAVPHRMAVVPQSQVCVWWLSPLGTSGLGWRLLSEYINTSVQSLLFEWPWSKHFVSVCMSVPGSQFGGTCCSSARMDRGKSLTVHWHGRVAFVRYWIPISCFPAHPSVYLCVCGLWYVYMWYVP